MGLSTGNSGDATTPLWKSVFKINTDDGSVESTFWHAALTKANARIRATGVGTRILGLLPTDAEIFSATLHKEDGKRDGFLLPDCIGAGLYGTLLGTPAPTKMNQFRDSILIRRETGDGRVTSINFAPYPDPIVTAGGVTAPPTSVIAGVPADPGPPDDTDVYAVRFTNFLTYLQWATNYVESGFKPGGTYKYDTWENLYAERTSTKKGGRVFTK